VTTQTIEAPRSARAARRTTNWEKWGWIYMRVSGVLLVVLVFGHLFVNLIAGDGVHQVDFAFVAGKWASPFWQVWDTLMLWLALIHGGNGMRTIINDYVYQPTIRRILLGSLLVSVAVLILLGTLVAWTFDPCPTGGNPEFLPSICAAAA
jgi:succinate dehydrogenase / fumarate reductase, membrane anchor subunit